jgi:hypothetical protein
LKALRDIAEATGVVPDELKEIEDKRPDMSFIDMELLKAYYWLRNSNPGGGFGHNPIPPGAYLEFANLLLSDMILSISIAVLIPGFADVMHAVDAAFLRLESEKEKAKSKSSKSAPKPSRGKKH